MMYDSVIKRFHIYCVSIMLLYKKKYNESDTRLDLLMKPEISMQWLLNTKTAYYGISQIERRRFIFS